MVILPPECHLFFGGIESFLLGFPPLVSVPTPMRAVFNQQLFQGLDGIRLLLRFLKRPNLPTSVLSQACQLVYVLTYNQLCS